jgi:Amt family ammonium transporter
LVSPATSVDPSSSSSDGSGASASAIELTVHPGDVAWLLSSTSLVLLMAIPGIGLFYGGLVKSKSTTSMLAQTFGCMALVGVLWALWGYSLAFSIDNPYIGGVSKCLMIGVTWDSVVATFTPGEGIPELVFFAFQMTFAMVTPSIIVGGPAERMTFPATMLFAGLWTTIVYSPVAHWTWVIPDPNLMVAAGWAQRNATTPAETEAAQKLLDHALGEAGWLARLGALDFAGGGVVHINSGFAALAASIIVGERVGSNEVEKPHSLTLSMIGTALLLVGWLGFNGGSALQGNGVAALAIANTLIAVGAGALSWCAVIGALTKKASLVALLVGGVAGAVAITPAAGLASPMGALVTGILVSPVCVFATVYLKRKAKYDDTLDAFGVHGVGGVFGALATAFLVSPAIGGTGIVDYANVTGGYVGAYDAGLQFGFQLCAVVVIALYSFVLSALILLCIKRTIGLRRSPLEEANGLDFVDHGEAAYSFGPDAVQFVELDAVPNAGGPRELSWTSVQQAPPARKLSLRDMQLLETELSQMSPRSVAAAAKTAGDEDDSEGRRMGAMLGAGKGGRKSLLASTEREAAKTVVAAELIKTRSLRESQTKPSSSAKAPKAAAEPTKKEAAKKKTKKAPPPKKDETESADGDSETRTESEAESSSSQVDPVAASGLGRGKDKPLQ